MTYTLAEIHDAGEYQIVIEHIIGGIEIGMAEGRNFGERIGACKLNAQTKARRLPLSLASCRRRLPDAIARSNKVHSLEDQIHDMGFIGTVIGDYAGLSQFDLLLLGVKPLPTGLA